MEETWKVLSGLLSYFEADDSHEAYLAFKIKASSAFASPSALAGRLGKRGGVSRASDQSIVTSSRRCKNLYTDDDAANILKLISGSTGIGKTNVTTKDTSLAEFDSANGIVVPPFVAADSSGTSIVEKDFEQNRNPIGMVISPSEDCVAADNATVMTEAAQ